MTAGAPASRIRAVSTEPWVCTAQALQSGLLDLDAFSESGLLAMSLTGLSAEDTGTRCILSKGSEVFGRHPVCMAANAAAAPCICLVARK